MAKTDPTAVRAIALDGGTTNTRARLVQGGRVLAEARRAVGVRDAALGGGPAALAEAVRACLDELDRFDPGGPRPGFIAAAGMLTSASGLVEVPHVPAPTGLDELARGVIVRRLEALGDREVAFVPGVRTPPGSGPDGWAEADVMRGEECETLGAWLALGRPSGRRAYLWPGSHSKLVLADGGRIVGSVTTLAGELFAALAGHTLLAASLPAVPPERPDPEASERGRRLAARDGLGRAAFAVRLADLAGALDPPERSALLLGAVLGDDADRLARHPLLDGGVPLVVGGREPQRGLYASWLGERRAGPVEPLDDGTAGAASALGALAVAERADG